MDLPKNYIGFSGEGQSHVETGFERPWMKDTGAWSRFFENTKYNTNRKSQELSHASLRLTAAALTPPALVWPAHSTQINL